MRVYLDNASTSFPKAPGVAEAISEYINTRAAGLYRTVSGKEEEIFDTLFSLRSMISSLYSYNHPECVAFTRNVTEALNWIIKGLFTSSDHIIVSSNEHNAVMRPLNETGIRFTRIPSDRKGYNAEFAAKHHLLLIIDTAQASPYVDINMEELGAAAIGFTGHKGFLGPDGTGGMMLRRDVAERIQPLIAGGTGSESDSEDVPHTLPERLSPGTENMTGLTGLECAMRYSLATLKENHERAMQMTERLYEGLERIDGIEIKGPGINERRCSVISISSDRKDISEIASLLLNRGGIETRVGLHCAPSAHRSLGTFPSGTLRFSPGPFTSEDEIDHTLSILKEIMNE